MSQNKIYLAIDLGAGSGRVLAGEFDGTRIELHELNRFDNTPVQLPSGWHWNITALYQNILEGLKRPQKLTATARSALASIPGEWTTDYSIKTGACSAYPISIATIAPMA